MLKKSLFTLVLGLALIAVISGVALAQSTDGDIGERHGLIEVYDEEMGWVGKLNDGRLNAYDLSAPIAVYYSHPLLPGGALSDAITGIEVYAIDPETGVGQPALMLSNADINRILSEEGVADCCLVEENGISLHYSTDGYFWVTTPADNGTTYSFEWPDFATRVLPTAA